MKRFENLSSGVALVAWAALVMTLAGCSRAVEPELQSLAIGGMANATPSIAASGDFVSVAWGATDASGSTDVYASVSRDGGLTFSEPVRVNDEDGGADLNGEQPPRVALIDRAEGAPVIAVVWTAKTNEGSRLLLSRSQDGGRSFGSDFVVPGSEAAGNRGWHSIVAAGGRVNTLWLDHREMANSTTATAHHQHAAGAQEKRDGVAMAQRSKLYFATTDGAVAPQAITGGVCYCCKTTLAAGSNGAIYTAWRHVYDGNIRDIAFTMSSDGGKTFSAPIRVSEDGWVLDGCPENGPAMVVGADQRIHVVWPTLVGEAGSRDETLALFYASSRDGTQFTPRQQIPTEGVPRHVQIALARDGGLVVAWDEAANGTRHIAMARGAQDESGQVTFVREAAGNAEGTYPMLAATTKGVVTAWTSGSPTDSVIRVAVSPR